jgi:predicted SAM-dependent methyltransferase
MEKINSDSIKLHLGCGNNKLGGYINIDSVKEFLPDLVHDISEPLPYSDQSVDEVLAEGVLEHFDKYVRYLVIYDWARVLRLGGMLNVSVPDFPKILSRFRKLGLNNFIDTIFGENMLQSETYIGHYGSHKFAYSEKSLTDFLKQFGLETIKVKHDGFSLGVIAKKHLHVTWDQIAENKIYAHANSFGDKPCLSLKEVLYKIAVFKSLDNK